MPVDATLVTVMKAYGLPGRPETFSAKSADEGVSPQFQLPRRFMTYIPSAMRSVLWAFVFRATVYRFLV